MPYQEINTDAQSNYVTMNNNPVFKIKLKSLSNAEVNQQKNGGKQNPGIKSDTLKIGDLITGYSQDKQEFFQGRITRIDDEKNEITIIDDESKKQIELEFDTCVKLHDDYYKTNDLTFTSEKEEFKTFKEFINS